MSTDSGEATPPPLPDALITPTTSGITKAEANTGPMNPTDCAMTSGSDRTFAPRRSYAGSELPIVSSFIVRAGLAPAPEVIGSSRFAYPGGRMCARHRSSSRPSPRQRRGQVHPDREFSQPVGEVRPDPARRAGQLEPGDATRQRAKHDAHLQPGQMRAQAQVRAAAAEAEMLVRGSADVERVRIGELRLVPVP